MQELRKNLKFLFKDFIFYGLITSLNKLSVLVTFPFLARYFSVADYGKLDFLLSVINFLIVVTVFGQDSAVGRFIQDQKTSIGKKLIITKSLFIQLISLCILGIILLFSKNYMTKLFFFENTALFYIIILQIPLLLFITASENIFKWTFSRKQFFTVSVLNVSIFFIATFFVIFYDKNIFDFFLIIIVGQFLLFLISFILVKKFISFSLGNFSFSELIKYGLPFGLICTISIAVPIIERIFVKSIMSVHQLGLYAVAIKVSMCLAVLAQAFQTAWGPFSLNRYKNKNTKEVFNLTLLIFSCFMCFLVIFLSGFAKYIILLLASEKYTDAYILVFPICFGYAIQFIGWIFEIGIHISKKTYLILYGYFIYILTSIISLIFLSKSFGLIGVASSVFIAFIPKVVIDTIISVKVWRDIWEWKKVLLVLICTFFISLSLVVVSRYISDVYSILITIISLIIFLTMCYIKLFKYSLISEKKPWNKLTFFKK